MNITCDSDTSNMTKEDRLAANVFFGITFHFEEMSKKELHSCKQFAENLLTNFMEWHYSLHKHCLKKKFFGKIFNFSEMTKEELSAGHEEASLLLRTIADYLNDHKKA